jgi:hypothetical protein
VPDDHHRCAKRLGWRSPARQLGGCLPGLGTVLPQDEIAVDQPAASKRLLQQARTEGRAATTSELVAMCVLVAMRVLVISVPASRSQILKREI